MLKITGYHAIIQNIIRLLFLDFVIGIPVGLIGQVVGHEPNGQQSLVGRGAYLVEHDAVLPLAQIGPVHEYVSEGAPILAARLQLVINMCMFSHQHKRLVIDTSV